MSDVMLLGILRMPIEPEDLEFCLDHITALQFISAAREAADRIEAETARADELQKRVDELTRPTQYHDVDEFYKEDKP